MYLGQLALLGPVKSYSDRLAQLSPGMTGKVIFIFLFKDMQKILKVHAHNYVQLCKLFCFWKVANRNGLEYTFDMPLFDAIC